MDDNPFRDDIKKWDVELPIKEFHYTLDQIAYMLDVSEKILSDQYLYYFGREWGRVPKDKLIARNIAPNDAPPNWRVSQTDFEFWMKWNGVHFQTKKKVTRQTRRPEGSR